MYRLFFITLLLNNVYASDFCNLDSLNEKSKAKIPVKNYENEIVKLGKILYSTKNCEEIKKLKSNNEVVFIDARGRGMRGSISGTLKLISDHDNQDEHEFKPDVFEKKVNNYLKKKKRNGKAKDYQFMIFCNGPTCYRTSWAACSLKKMGYEKDKLHLILDGFIGLKKNCL